MNKKASGIKFPARRILDRSGVGTLIVGADGIALYVNDAFTRLLGYTAEERVGRGTLELLHEDDRELVAGRHETIRKGGVEGYQAERRFLHKNGTVIPTMTSVAPLNDARGKPQYVIVQVVDISTQKEAEQALAASEDRWNFALESARQGVWDSDLTTGEMFYSNVWREMRGLKPDDDIMSIGEWQDRIHPDDRERVFEAVSWQDRGGSFDEGFEYREKHRDGHWMWILARGRAIAWDETGKPTRIIGTDTDITHLKQSEQAVESMSRRLELALDVSGVGVWEFVHATGEINCDSRLAKMYAIPESEGDVLTLELLRERLHPDDLERVMKTVNASVRTGSRLESLHRLCMPDGSVKHIEMTGNRYFDVDGNPKYLGVSRDITQEVESAEALRQAKNLAEKRNTELEVARAEMEHASLHDALTGLPNRRFLDEKLTALSKGDQGAALLHIDLDRFKQINDTLGHAAGDAMLVHAAEVLRRNVSEKDFVARVGGDEFVVLIFGEKSDEALARIASAIVRSMSEPVTYNEHECRFGVSVGIASFHDGNTGALQSLVNADIALYRAKAKGRNRYEFFTNALQAEIVTTKQRADEILYGLEQNQFFPVYQPQFDAETYAILGVEALARWQHPSGEVMMPQSFLRIAEDLNVVARIDRLIMEKSLADLDRWIAADLGIPAVSVNVSALRLHDEELINSLQDISWRPGSLSFELLESIFLDDSEEIVTWNIDRIKEMGINIDIDDFGTGHASIVGLLKLEPHRLKIDRQLVGPIARSAAQRNLVKSIIEIGHSLGIRVVAEGVETREHVTILQELGCDALQGYFFAKPMTAAELECFVASGWQKRVS